MDSPLAPDGLSPSLNLLITDMYIVIVELLLTAVILIYIAALKVQPDGAWDGYIGILSYFGMPIFAVVALVVLALRVSVRFRRLCGWIYHLALTDRLIIVSETLFIGAFAVWIWGAISEIRGGGSHGLLAWEGFVFIIFTGVGILILGARIVYGCWKLRS